MLYDIACLLETHLQVLHMLFHLICLQFLFKYSNIFFKTNKDGRPDQITNIYLLTLYWILGYIAILFGIMFKLILKGVWLTDSLFYWYNHSFRPKGNTTFYSPSSFLSLYFIAMDTKCNARLVSFSLNVNMYMFIWFIMHFLKVFLGQPFPLFIHQQKVDGDGDQILPCTFYLVFSNFSHFYFTIMTLL